MNRSSGRSKLIVLTRYVEKGESHGSRQRLKNVFDIKGKREDLRTTGKRDKYVFKDQEGILENYVLTL